MSKVIGLTAGCSKNAAACKDYVGPYRPGLFYVGPIGWLQLAAKSGDELSPPWDNYS